MKRVVTAACLAASAFLLGATGVAVARPAKAVTQAEASTVPSLSRLFERELHWGQSREEVTSTYNKLNGLFDREYAPRLAKLQPGVEQQDLAADRDNRKADFARSYTSFDDDPTGYDVTPLHLEFTYRNGEAVQKLFKDGKTRYFFFIKDKLWKIYDEVSLRAGGPFGQSFQEAVTKLNALLGAAGRVRAASSAQGLERTEVDWQDRSTHLRAIDRSGEHIIGLVLEDRDTLNNLASLRTSKPVDPFAIDPSISNITKTGISDPNAQRLKEAAPRSKKHH